jgi:hypothetical protein
MRVRYEKNEMKSMCVWTGNRTVKINTGLFYFRKKMQKKLKQELAAGQSLEALK